MTFDMTHDMWHYIYCHVVKLHVTCYVCHVICLFWHMQCNFMSHVISLVMTIMSCHQVSCGMLILSCNMSHLSCHMSHLSSKIPVQLINSRYPFLPFSFTDLCHVHTWYVLWCTCNMIWHVHVMQCDIHETWTCIDYWPFVFFGPP